MATLGEAWQAVDLKAAWKRVLSGGGGYLALLAFFGLLLLAGILAGLHAQYVVGTQHAYGVTREIPLAILISTYIYFVVTSTGLCLVSSIGHVFGLQEFMPIAKRSVLLSIITILAGFLVIGLEIENPFRMAIYNVISPNLRSNIWWMGTLYGAYLVFMAIEFVFLMTANHRVAVVAGLLGVISGVAAHSNLGGIFAMLHGRDYWYGSFMPIYFIASAMMTGCAFIIFFTVVAYRLRREPMDGPTIRSMEIVGKLTTLMLVVVMFFTTWKMITLAVGGTGELLALDALIRGSFAFSFWVLEVGLGMVVPFMLFLWSRGRRIGIMFFASTLMIFCIFFMRLDLVVVGQIVPVYIELGVREYAQLHTYSPSWHEILVVLGGFGFCGFAFLLGEKVFDGFREENGHEGTEPVAPPAGEAEVTS